VRRPAIRRAPTEYNEAFVDTMAGAYLAKTRWTSLRLSAILDLVDPQPGERILDLGCTAGAVAHFLSTHGAETVGVDSEPLAIERGRELFPELEFHLADVAELPFEDESFDKAVAADLVEHLDEGTFERMLAEAYRVLRPGGTLAIYTPNPKHWVERAKARDFVLAQNPTHIGLRPAEALAAAFRRAGFEVDRDEWRPIFLPLLNAAERIAGRATTLFRYRLCLRGRKRAPSFVTFSVEEEAADNATTKMSGR
jgi:SAM-dependent methyltransferase